MQIGKEGLYLLVLTIQEKLGGPDDSVEKLTNFLNSLQPKPRLEYEWVFLDDKRVFVIKVTPEKNKIYVFGNDVYLRMGSSTRKARLMK